MTAREAARAAAREGFTHYAALHHRMEGADRASDVWESLLREALDIAESYANKDDEHAWGRIEELREALG